MKSMTMKTVIFTLIVTFLMMLGTTEAQNQRQLRELEGHYVPEELVTLSPNLPFKKAIELLSIVSEKMTGRKIVMLVDYNEPIGLEIDNMPYDKALTLIVQYANLRYEVRKEVIAVLDKVSTEEEQVQLDPTVYASVDSREVKISAVFFELDVGNTRERGINWQVLLSDDGVNLGTDLQTFSVVDEENQANQNQGGNLGNFFDISSETEFTMGDFSGSAALLFRFLENENLGEVIASPTVTVRDDQEGRIQIGSDFSVKQRDFAGNVTDFFYSTGSIIEVIPHVIHEDGLDYVLLDLKVERSAGFPGELSTEIRKSVAETEILMLDGEQTVIGGLFINETVTTRVGIPFLKDLPWWVFGIRYLAGSDKTVVSKKELIILIKAELLPTLKERVSRTKTEDPIKEELQRGRDLIKFYELNLDSGD